MLFNIIWADWTSTLKYPDKNRTVLPERTSSENIMAEGIPNLKYSPRSYIALLSGKITAS